MTQEELIKGLYQQQIKILLLNQTLDLAQLTEKEKNCMISQPVADLIAKFDTATDSIAARIAAIVAKQSTLSDDDKAAFQAEIDKLNLLGQDPSNPVPQG